jgi:hypothetical protein
VRQAAKSNEFKKLVLLEIISRTIKNELRALMRLKTSELGTVSIAPPRELILDYFNMLIGVSTVKQRSKEYWKKTLKTQILSRYPMALTDLEQDENYSLFKRVDLHALFTRLEVPFN